MVAYKSSYIIALAYLVIIAIQYKSDNPSFDKEIPSR